MTSNKMLLMVAFLLGACGGKDENDDSGTDTSTTSNPATGTNPGTGTDTTVPTVPTNPADCVEEGGACVLSGVYTDDMTLTADKPWLLRGLVQIGDDGTDTTLTIQPGTSVYGESATSGLLVITRGAKIMAEGTANNPIRFTSDQPEGSRNRGDWGGITINGYGTLNACADDVDPCEAEGEGGTGLYGGNDNADNSGVLKYVVIEYGGTEISPDNEVNGLGLQGVGSGTTIDYVQIHRNQDDGIEFWGGAVNAKHIVVTAPGDDGIDWDLGWQGKLQFAVVEQADDDGNNGTECDGNDPNFSATPLSNPTVSNVTFIGSEAIAADNFGMLFRRGAAPKYWNIAATGFSSSCLAIRDAETIAHFGDGTAELSHVTLACDTNFEDADEQPIFTAGMGNSEVADLELNGWVPAAGSPLLGAGMTPSDAFFDDVDFIGGIGADDWTAGWTTNAVD